MSILEALHHNNRLSLAEIVDILKVKYPHPYLKSLLDKGKITLYEEISEGYAEKKISKITLSPKLKEDDESMKQAFDQLSRAPKQEALFLHFLHRFQDVGEKPISKKKLLTSSSSSPAVLKGLIDKKILIQYEEEIGRITGYKGDTKKLPELSSAQHRAFESVITFFKQ